MSRQDLRSQEEPAHEVEDRREAALDAALKDSFPASDPIALEQPAPPEPEQPLRVPTVRARQGVTGHNVRRVLLFGTMGVVVAFALIYLAFTA